MNKSVSLTLTDISKRYGQVTALKPMNLEVAPGELIALLGPSGCGKTTTLRIISGFETPDTGSVRIGTRDVTGLSPNMRDIGLMFQNYALFPHMTVAENVGFGLKMRGIAKAEAARRIETALDMVRMRNFGDRAISQLSGGQQQRIALARSLVVNPSVLLLDEPLGALDKKLREEMQFELRQLQRSFCITSILVTHDQEEALTMSDRVAVMGAGEIRQIGTPQDIYARPNSIFVSEFLGTSNIFSGKLRSGFFVADGVPALRIACTGEPDGPSSLVFRPEKLQITAAGKGQINARVRDVVFRGSQYTYELTVDGHEKPVIVYSQQSFDLPGDGVVGLDWSDAPVLLREVAE
ncbi:spermidine/putrescine ABC transporter ATP-binding subunit [Pseudochelatococcus lubricantis]|uniref:Spermidine/putrescine ABC transporter ATP-binding subunit n=1 Tax=Pseudochelatococcus lubricantis TaxID=1538102 RepID=A0ABX0UWI1_9HYPH|nr:ABC transporter ATP-binding protein [Pseudochelatococcus lubricantis]NIJ56229.1 spermidine/putrescine ABC transporter ATP-binding subunit [Pseudochelatococcus lubricantis]